MSVGAGGSVGSAIASGGGAVYTGAPMKRICSWCETVLTEGTEPATHTCCPDCLASKFGEYAA